jgi:hypothetical protein
MSKIRDYTLSLSCGGSFAQSSQEAFTKGAKRADIVQELLKNCLGIVKCVAECIIDP